MTLARACRDHEHVTADYVDRAGRATGRRLEPYQLVTTGRRWYSDGLRPRPPGLAEPAVGPDVRRARGRQPFTSRDAPDAAAFVGRSISASPYRYVARVRYFAPYDVVAQHFSPDSATVEPDGSDACVMTAGGDDAERIVLYLAMVGADFEVLEPAEVADAVGRVAERLRRASRG